MFMKPDSLRQIAPRSHHKVSAMALSRPRPTAASALLLAVVLSLPFIALSVVQVLF
jgi:hypothetical protein